MRKPIFDMRMLRYFVAVAEERHFGRAAERLNIAQPPLSQQIKRLENELGTVLLLRTTRRVELTTAGELLLARGKLLLSDAARLAEDVQKVGRGLEGSVRLGLTGSATYGLMPKIVRATAAALPELDLHVSGESLTPVLERQLLSGQIDVALLRPPVDSTNIKHTIIAYESLVAALPADSPLADRAELHLRDVTEGALVGYPANSSVSRVLDTEIRSAGQRPRYSNRVPETSTLISLVSAGLGMAIVPESAMALKLSGVLYRPIVDAPTVALATAWRSDETSDTVRRYVDFLRETIPTLLGEV
ncbi:LysR substrate-binding domain-containing protein [Cryobacterium sp. PH29-G1]|uniref:LysR substrate-binding domain-containing protein n=1 Tax=Cryobacterium sp. PH29-G1 TaxID=3046211 RepID=UPI0024B9C112|nr:LysR substrate-binding domain-containing protein [Cryobacterium sp. PH29-G1]MDJ0347939.1 LysR substrate-binding domain-containing protein [Cryobacterium sp. PH29-G1]